ncbi:MAG TPA: Hsp20/alpha crystallin family protein [bacterium]|jgi:HSP20 family protein|nr:Hsp20/alpha crystallin family protein [bacterium]
MREAHLPVNVYEEDGRIMVASPLPGMEPASISIEVVDQTLRIKANLRGPGQLRTQQYQVHEWTAGPYERAVELAKPVDTTKANASYDNGVLVVMLPIAEKAVPGVIQMAKIGTAKGQVIGQTGHVR